MKYLFPLLFAAVVGAQQPPLETHRQVAPPMPSIDEIQKAAQLLTEAGRQAQPLPVAIPIPPNPQEGPPLVAMPEKAPKGYKIRTEVPLNSSTSQALTMATKFLDRPNVPHEGKDGRLIYSYGAGLATLVCAPLRWCLIELIPGETVKHAVPSDERWDAKPLIDTSGEHPRSIIAMRPKYSGLDSSLVIVTDQRSYYLRLVSEPTSYMSRIAFDDPEAEREKATQAAWDLREWQAHLAAIPAPSEYHAAAEKPKMDQTIHPYMVSGEKDFRGKEKRPYFWPVAAYEQGGLVYVKLPKEVADQRSPSLHRWSKSGKAEPMNYSTEGNTFIAHTVEPQMVLLHGDGKKAEKVFLTRGGK